jgi:hypothetical protein
MAGIRKKGDGYHCTFRFQGRRFYFAVGKLTEAQGLAKATEVDETLARARTVPGSLLDTKGGMTAALR